MAESKANICFSCKKACGGCSWSEIDLNTKKVRFEPVPGWTAKKRRIRTNGHKEPYDYTYHITACPEFEPEEPRTEEHIRKLMQKIMRGGL